MQLQGLPAGNRTRILWITRCPSALSLNYRSRCRQLKHEFSIYIYILMRWYKGILIIILYILMINFYFSFWPKTHTNTSRNVFIPERYSNTKLIFFQNPLEFYCDRCCLCFHEAKERPCEKIEMIQYIHFETIQFCCYDFTFLNMIF